jgi:hypothetical protein
MGDFREDFRNKILLQKYFINIMKMHTKNMFSFPASKEAYPKAQPIHPEITTANSFDFGIRFLDAQFHSGKPKTRGKRFFQSFLLGGILILGQKYFLGI